MVDVTLEALTYNSTLELEPMIIKRRFFHIGSSSLGRVEDHLGTKEKKRKKTRYIKKKNFVWRY